MRQKEHQGAENKQVTIKTYISSQFTTPKKLQRYIIADDAYNIFSLSSNDIVDRSDVQYVVEQVRSTPYMLIFKYYDWLKLDFDGKPPPITVDYKCKHLNDRSWSDNVVQELLASSKILEEPKDGEVIFVIVDLIRLRNPDPEDGKSLGRVETKDCSLDDSEKEKRVRLDVKSVMNQVLTYA